MEKHYLPGLIDKKLGEFKSDLAETFREILKSQMGDLPNRVTALEGIQTRTLIYSLLAFMLSGMSFLSLLGRILGWW